MLVIFIFVNVKSEAPMLLRSVLLATLLASPLAATAQPLAPVEVTEWKPVYGRIEAKDRLPARARIGGTLVELTVAEAIWSPPVSRWAASSMTS